MKKGFFALSLILPWACATAIAESQPSIENGKQLYDQWCVICHANSEYSAGTRSLQFKYQGAVPSVLEQRTDLAPELIKMVVRNGLYTMPRTRKTEISDAELDDIIAYLTDKPRN